MQDADFQLIYTEDANFALILRQLVVLIFVPEDDVIVLFEDVPNSEKKICKQYGNRPNLEYLKEIVHNFLLQLQRETNKIKKEINKGFVKVDFI